MFWSAILFGLLGSFHCIGMCGPIAFILPVDKNKPVKLFFQLASYHLGKLFTYGIIGLVFGFLGRGFYLLGLQQQISIIMGIFMILLVLFPKISNKNVLSKKVGSIIIKIKSGLGKELQKKQNDTLFIIGFLNGFLPCGLVYMAVLGAIATGGVLTSSFYMILFGLGTIPLLTAVTFLGNFTKINFRQKLQKAIPAIVFFIGVLFVLRGLGLGIPYLSPDPSINTVSNSVLICK